MSKVKTIMPLLAVSALLVGCAKEREYETVYKDPEITSKSAIDQDGEFVYVGYTLGVPRFTRSARPFVQGREKLVKFRFTEDGLVAYEIEKDERHVYNKLNNKPIVTVPSKYKSYRCRENSNKECTNHEEENNELEWFQKDQFIPDFAKTKVLKNDSMGLPDKNDSCFSETGSKLVNYELSKDVLNIEVEKTYKFSDSWSCIRKLFYSAKDWTDVEFNKDDAGSFHVRAFHSFVKLDKLATPGYEAVEYNLDDQNTFGFFKDTLRVEDNTTRISRKYLLNRFMPGKEVVFHLSDEYARPENKFLADATYKAVSKMNEVMSKNGVDLKLKIEKPSGKNPGDLRHNMIVLVEGLATSLLGYGPTVTNPKTGEIIKAHTNMYKGTLTSTVPHVWRSMQDLERDLKNKALRNSAPKVAAAPSAQAASEEDAISKDTLELMRKASLPLVAVNKKANAKHVDHGHNHDHASHKFAGYKKVIEGKYKELDEAALTKKLIKDVNLTEKERFEIEMALSDKKMYEEMNKNNVYTVNMFNFQTLGKTGIESVANLEGSRDENGNLIDWNKLPKKVQAQAIEKLVVHVYTSTLVHELGHNLGLRHNFMGSFDKANFYSEEERKNLGIKRGSVFSSVMDYSYSELNQLTTLGKYDIAALKFGYNREVELTNGQLLKIGKDESIATAVGSKAPGQFAKNYEFCTDENAGANVTCNRFDEGSSYTEIARHKMTRYFMDSKNYRNFRGDYLNRRFSDYQLIDYLIGTYRRLVPMKANYEMWYGLYTYLKGFGAEYEQMAFTGCDDATRNQAASFCNQLDDIITASDESARFLIDLVKTDDRICLVKDASGQISQVPLAQVDATKVNFRGDMFPVSSCFEKEAKAALAEQKLTVVAQTGEYINNISAKYKSSMKIYTGDLDVRGNWIDKVIATEMLFSEKRLGSVGADLHASFLDHPMYGAELINLVDHLAVGEQLKAPNYYYTETGKKMLPLVNTNLNAEIEQPIDQRFNWFLGIPNEEKFKLAPVLLNKATGSNSDYYVDMSANRGRHKQLNSFARQYSRVSVRSTRRANNQFGEAIIAQTQIGEDIYGASKYDKLALRLINVINGNKEIKERLNQVQLVPTPEEVAKMATEVSSMEGFGTVLNPSVVVLEKAKEMTKVDMDRISVTANLRIILSVLQRDVNIFLEMLQAGKNAQDIIDEMGQERFNNVSGVYSLLMEETQNADEHTDFLFGNELTVADILMFMQPEYEKQKVEEYKDMLFYMNKN